LEEKGTQNGTKIYECESCGKRSALPSGIRISKNRTTKKPLIENVRNLSYLKLLDIYHYLQENNIKLDDIMAIRKTLKDVYNMRREKSLDLAIFFYYLVHKRPEGLDLAISKLEDKSILKKKVRKNAIK